MTRRKRERINQTVQHCESSCSCAIATQSRRAAHRANIPHLIYWQMLGTSTAPSRAMRRPTGRTIVIKFFFCGRDDGKIKFAICDSISESLNPTPVWRSTHIATACHSRWICGRRRCASFTAIHLSIELRASNWTANGRKHFCRWQVIK